MPCLSLERFAAFLLTLSETEAGWKPLVLLTGDDLEATKDLEAPRVWIPSDFELKAEESKSPQLERTRLHTILIIGMCFMGRWRGTHSLAQWRDAIGQGCLSRVFRNLFKLFL